MATPTDAVETRPGLAIPAEKLGYKYSVNCYLLYCAFWGGFLHITVGYDSGVAGGLFTKASFIKRFYPNFHGRSASPYCTLYRYTIAIAGLGNIIGAIVQITAHSSTILLAGRSIVGFGEGFGMYSYAIYLVEIAPAQLRGKFAGSSVTWSATGVMLGQLVNFLVKQRTNGWQIAIGVVIIPAGLLLINSFFMTDTPASLLMRGKPEQAKKALQRLRGMEDVEAEFADIVYGTQNRVTFAESFQYLKKKQYWPILISNVITGTLLNWTGNSAIVYYGPQIFSLLGLGTNVALWNSLVVGAAKLTGVFVGLYLLDKMKRRVLLMWGGILQTIFLVATAIIFSQTVHNHPGGAAGMTHAIAGVVLALIIAYEISFMGGQHVGSQAIVAEIVPIELRPSLTPATAIIGYGQAIILSYTFTYQLCAMTWGTFLFMASFAVLLFFWAYFGIPETHHIPLDRIQPLFAAHPWWHRFYKDVDTAESATKGSIPLEDFKGTDSSDDGTKDENSPTQKG